MLLIYLIFGLIFGSYGEIEERMLGGRQTTIEKYPYQLSLEISGTPNCSASIIGNNWALTAASCVNDTSAAKITLRAGSTKKNSGGTVHQASKVVTHPDYNRQSGNNDFAVIKVTNAFAIGSPGVDKIPLTWDEALFLQLANVTGWGVITPEGRQTDNLQVIVVPTISRALCKGVYWGIVNITTNMLCAGYSQGGVGPCTGDTGSPLVIEGTQYGIVSMPPCEEQNKPGVYGEVASARPWIRHVTEI